MTTDEALIQKTPGVMGGEACIRRTRISVWMLVNAWRLGFTGDELLDRYGVPLTREDPDVLARAFATRLPRSTHSPAGWSGSFA